VAAGGARALLIGRRALVIPRVAARPKDLEDIRLLQVLQAEEER
jgi:hypothetical protein